MTVGGRSRGSDPNWIFTPAAKCETDVNGWREGNGGKGLGGGGRRRIMRERVVRGKLTMREREVEREEREIEKSRLCERQQQC